MEEKPLNKWVYYHSLDILWFVLVLFKASFVIIHVFIFMGNQTPVCDVKGLTGNYLQWFTIS